MQIYSSLVVLLTIVVQVFGVRRITLDDDSQALCKKYKMMCKADKICAVQHFDWPSNITIPVCIPLSFVPVRNMICKLPPDTGRCLARYIRWYYNIHSQECTHFQYGGCEGNQNNFMSKTDCEETCVSTPSIRLYEGGHSALVQPSIITAPVYEPPKSNGRVEALNSVREQPVSGYTRHEIIRHRPIKTRDDAGSNNRTRRHQEREKERKRREKKKEKKRLKKLRREQKKLRCKKRRERGKTCKKDRKSSKKRKSNKKKPIDRKEEIENMVETIDNDVEKVRPEDVMAEAKNIIKNEVEAVEEDDDDDDKNKKKDKGRKKRKLREKRRNEKERSRRNLNTRKSRKYSEYTRKSEAYSQRLFSILDPQRQYQQPESSLVHTLRT